MKKESSHIILATVVAGVTAVALFLLLPRTIWEYGVIFGCVAFLVAWFLKPYKRTHSEWWWLAVFLTAVIITATLKPTKIWWIPVAVLVLLLSLLIKPRGSAW
jgi:hypothetical protein